MGDTSPTWGTIGPPYRGPAPGFPLGTDYLGRDVLSRILDGGHDLLVLPLIATALATTMGVLTGITIGYLGGRTDRTIMALINVLLAIPALLVLLVVVRGPHRHTRQSGPGERARDGLAVRCR